MKKITKDIKAGEQFEHVGNVDGKTRKYTVLARTTATYLDGGNPVSIENVTARNEETGGKAVFALAALVG